MNTYEALSVFDEKSKEYQKLKAASDLINTFINTADENMVSHVENCIFDVGQDWHYTTILMGSSCMGTAMPAYQLLSPAEQVCICFGTYEEYTDCVGKIIQKINKRKW